MDPEPAPAQRPSSAGSLILLLGLLDFVVSSFLPFASIDTMTTREFSFFQMATSARDTGVATVGAYLYLFAGVGVLAALAVIAHRGGATWTVGALAGGTAVWSVTWVGILLGVLGLATPIRLAYWMLLVSIAVVVAGAILVWIADRRMRSRPFPA